MDINIHVGMLSWIACDTLLIFSLAGPMWHYWLLLLSHTSSCRPCLKDLFGECSGIFLLFVYILLLLVVWLYKVYWLHRNRLCLSMVNRQLKKNKIKSFCKEFLSDKIIIFFSVMLTGSSFQLAWWFVMTSLLIFLVMFIFFFNFNNASFVHNNLLLTVE